MDDWRTLHRTYGLIEGKRRGAKYVRCFYPCCIGGGQGAAGLFRDFLENDHMGSGGNRRPFSNPRRAYHGQQ